MKKLILNLLLLLMMAVGAVAQNQLNEGFESTTFPPDDWTAINVSGSSSWERSSSYYHDGAASASVNYAYSGHENYLVTPMLVPAADEALTFYVSSQQYSGTTLTVEVSTTTATASAFTTTLATYTTGSSGTFGTTTLSTFVEKTITASELEPYVGQQIYIAFHVVDDNGSRICIDDVSGITMYVPTCPKPATVTAASITSVSADIAWTPAGSESEWALKWGVAGFDIETAGTLVENLDAASYSLTGLTANTQYDVYVKAVCSDSEESEWRSTSFRTECGLQTIPYTETFEAVTGSYAIPDCWERIVEYASYGTTYPYVSTNSYYTTYSHTGEKGLYMYTYPYYDAYENVIALPEMNSISTLQISLWAKASSTIPENFEIGYIKSGVFTSVQSFTLTTDYQQFTAYLNGAPADAERIAIRAYHSTTSITVYVDDIEVSPMPTCIAPVDVVVSGITTNAASVSWTDVLPATAWQYQLNDSEIADAESNPINLTGLTANTEYTIKVRTVCGEGEYSDWAEGSFTTLCDAVAEFPWTENFNSLTSGIPSCWDNSEGTTTDVSYRWNYYATGHEGAGLRFNSYNNSNYNTNMLKTVSLDLAELTSAKLGFWYKNPTGGDFSVYVSTDGGATYTDNVIATGLTGVSAWTNAVYDISSYCGNSNVVIVFKGTSNYGYGDAYIYLDDVTVRESSTAAEILTYSLPTQVSEATIGDGTIEVTVANSTDFDVDLTPTYTISENAEISDPVVTGEGDVRTIAYTVTAEAGNTKDWTVTVTKAPISHDAFITAFTFAGQKEGTTAEIVSENDTYAVDAVAEWNVDLTAIAPVVTISNAATVAPESGDVQNFTTPVTYTVTAEDGTTTHAYTVTIINDPDACINPATVSISNITNNSATASWAQAYTETSYLVKVSTEAMTDMTATADFFDGTVEATTKELEGLTANTQYFVYVQSDCDNAEGWTLSSFTTLCDAVAEFPWTEDFNSLTVSNSIPSCWDNSEGTTTTESYKWCYTTSSNYSGYGSSSGTSHDGSNCVRFDSYNNSNNRTNMLKTPSLDLTELTSAKLDFWYKNVAGGDFSVYVSTDGGATYTDNVIATGLTGVSSWTNAVYDISSYCGNSNVVIVFMGTSNYGSGNAYIYLDDVTVREPYTGAEIVDFTFPMQMSAPGIDNEAATVTATASYQADLENLGETVTVSDGAEYVAGATSIEGNVKTFEYTVTAENGTTKDWRVTVTKAESASTANDIVAFSFVGQVGESAIDPEAKTVTAYAEWDFDLENNTIAPTIEVSPMATINPLSGDAQNFSAPVQYAVTAEDGESVANWTVTITNDPNACINPAEIALDAATATTATLKWEKAYLETSYLVKVSTTEMDDMDAEADVYDGEVTLTGDEATLELTGLTPATFYYIYVQSNCGADGWTDGLFGTECDGSAYSVPFVETFDLSSQSLLCWNIIDANEDVNEYGQGAWNFTGEDVVYYYSSYNAANDWLISPKIAVVDGAYLTFDYKGDGYYTEKFSVYVMDAPANYAEATQILATQIVDNADYESIANIDLSAYADQDIYIGIKCESDADQDVLFIDNFTVTLPVYTITATAGENGTIDPASAEVMYGYDKTFTITPAEGYRIAAVVVDAETEGEANVTVVAGDGYYTYTFTNVTANHTIHATFEAIPTYTITVNAGENGNVYYNDALVSAPIVVTEGATPEFEITPATGYQIDVLTVGGNTVELTEQQLGGFTYTFEPVMADITLAVTFEAIPAQTYTITVNAGENGTVTYNDEEVTAPVVVNEGDTPAFVITPAENYQIDVLSVDETPVELTPEQLLEGYTYTFAAVEGDHTLTVTFVPVQSADMLEAGSMSIYPNPNNGMFSIDFSNIEGDATYQIIDARGAVVETRDINVMNGETMNFNHDLRPGAYFVRIINGDKVYVEQIVVE